MLYFFESKLERILARNFSLTQIEQIKIKYILVLSMSELSKFFLLVFFFNTFGLLEDFLWLTLSLLIFRPRIGGFHFNSYLKCFSFTLIFSLNIIFFKNYILLTPQKIILLGIFSLISIYFLAPLVSKQKREYIKPRNPWEITSLALLHIVVLLGFPQNPYLLITIWALFSL